jgi:hypothetical protein
MNLVPVRPISRTIECNGPVDREQVRALLGLVVAGKQLGGRGLVVLEVLEGLTFLPLRSWRGYRLLNKYIFLD